MQLICKFLLEFNFELAKTFDILILVFKLLNFVGIPHRHTHTTNIILQVPGLI